jgi:hypothetical protein
MKFANRSMIQELPRDGLRVARLGVIGAALAFAGAAFAADAQSLPIKPQLHKQSAQTARKTKKAKSRSAVRTTSIKSLTPGEAPSARSGPVSPYERAAAQRAQAGLPPAGHAVARPLAAPAAHTN